MTDKQLTELLRTAMPPTADDVPRRDRWPQMATRFDARPRWSYLDLGLAAAAGLALTAFPDWLWLLADHL